MTTIKEISKQRVLAGTRYFFGDGGYTEARLCSKYGNYFLLGMTNYQLNVNHSYVLSIYCQMRHRLRAIWSYDHPKVRYFTKEPIYGWNSSEPPYDCTSSVEPRSDMCIAFFLAKTKRHK